MPEESTRRSFLAAAGTGVAAALAGCGGNAPDQTDTESPTEEPTDAPETTEPSDDTESTPQSGGTLQMLSPGAIQTLDPISAKGSGVGFNQYGQSLMRFPNGTLPPEPALAKGYELSDDGLTYTFTLREGVTFHDGSELTAEDVVYSFRRLAESDNSRNRDDIIGDTMTVVHERDPSDSETLSDVVPQSLAVEATGDYTVEMTLESPFRFTLHQIAGGAFAVIPANSVGDIEGYDGEYDYNEFFSTSGDGPKYAGAGPFEIDSWSKGDSLSLTAFDDYYGTAPNVDGITYTVVTEANTRLSRFQNGSADILSDMATASFTPSNVSDLETQSGNRSVGTYDLEGTTVNYGEVPALRTEYLVFNTLNVPTPVRKAFAYALNQHSIAENVYKGTAQPAYHITPEGAFPTANTDADAGAAYEAHAKSGDGSVLDVGADGYMYGYGESLIDEATRVMEEAGYGPDNTFSLTATTKASGNAYRSVFTRLQSKLGPAHIEMDIEQAQEGTIISRAIKGSMDVFALGDGMEYPGPENFLRFLWGNNPSNQFTRWGAEESYHDAELRQTAMDAWNSNYASEDADASSRAKAFRAIEEVNWAAVQELPTVHPTHQRFWHTDVDVEMHGVMENQTFTDLTLNR